MNQNQLFSDRVLSFYQQLKIEEKLPKGVEVLNPYQDNNAFDLCTKFYKKYYDDNEARYIIFGINPGRFGGGLTGIPFTDPVKLEQICGIANNLPKKAELSADFIYAMIDAFGGTEKFYNRIYINSVSPLGFTFEGKNLNYYDTPALLKRLESFIRNCIQSQISFGINSEVAFCLGEGENFKYLNRLNAAMGYFKELIPLAHPRFIMQYRRRQMDYYITDYLKKLQQ